MIEDEHHCSHIDGGNQKEQPVARQVSRCVPRGPVQHCAVGLLCDQEGFVLLSMLALLTADTSAISASLATMNISCCAQLRGICQ